jgi:hypothetical protein
MHLDIRYNGKSVPVVIKDGRAWVAEPREGDKVELVLRRNDASQEVYGVVLTVNGENTLYKQRLSPELCSKWIFGPGAAPYTIEGFKTDVASGEAFRVLSRAESKKNEVYYGADSAPSAWSSSVRSAAATRPSCCSTTKKTWPSSIAAFFCRASRTICRHCDSRFVNR